jgi:hypothetical protein
VPIKGDDACFINALYYLIHKNQNNAAVIRPQIVEHVEDNWEYFSILTHDHDGHNHPDSMEYFFDMSLPYTWWSDRAGRCWAAFPLYF